MTDIVPDSNNRLAWLLGKVFHPYLISVLTLAVVLRDLPLREAVFWIISLSLILIVPGLVLIQYYARRARYTYQRQTRTPIFIAFGISVVVCILLIIGANGPHELLACFVALLIWLPTQLFINTVYTKLSVHSAIVAACAFGLYLLGALPGWLLQGLALIAVLATGWARHRTRNHTWEQVTLGWLVGGLSVVVAFALVL